LQGLFEEAENTLAWISGTGAALNCDLSLVNLVGREDRIMYFDGDGMLSRHHKKNDPGIGAYSPFYNRYNVATRDIVPGEELFDSYGDGYFSDRTDKYGYIPLTDDYEKADHLLQHYITLRGTIATKLEESSQEHHHVKSFEQYGRSVVDQIEEDWYKIMSNMLSIWPSSRILNALPENYEDVDILMELGGTAWKNHYRSIKPLKSLEDEGRCMDHIESGASTISHAGRGAFARRRILAGHVIGPAPVVHMRRREMNMRQGVYNMFGQYIINATGPVVHQQLVLNYCYGHRHSSLVRFQYLLLQQRDSMDF